jgi:hypothetical protein
MSLLDAPCGDWNWMQEVALPSFIQYFGYDLDVNQIVDNHSRFGFKSRVEFSSSNLLEMDKLPKVDLILCRDFLQHLPNDEIARVLKLFIDSGSRYLITNNFRGAANDTPCPPEGHTNAVGMADPLPGYYYRPVNVEVAPFFLQGRLEALPKPIAGETEYADIPQELVLYDLRKQ